LVGLALWIAWSVVWFVRMVARVVASLGDRVAAFGVVVVAWFFFLMFLAFFGGIANFQNYINNVFLWFLSGMVFALPLDAGRSDPGDRAVATREGG
jgi:hypothetical protein